MSAVVSRISWYKLMDAPPHNPSSSNAINMQDLLSRGPGSRIRHIYKDDKITEATYLGKFEEVGIDEDGKMSRNGNFAMKLWCILVLTEGSSCPEWWPVRDIGIMPFDGCNSIGWNSHSHTEFVNS